MTKAEKLLEAEAHGINEFVIHGLPARIVKKVWRARKGEGGRVNFVLRSGETLGKNDFWLLHKEDNVLEITTTKINNLPLLVIVYQAGKPPKNEPIE